MTDAVAPAAAPTPRAQGSLMLAVAVPVIASTLAVALFVGFELAGHTPLSMWPDNLAEAVGMGNGAETLRLLRFGADPTRVQSVRPEIISSVITRVTALEAAVFARKVEIVRMMDSRQTIVGDEARRALACLAADVEAEDIREYLTRAGDPPCAPGAARARVVERSALAAS